MVEEAPAKNRAVYSYDSYLRVGPHRLNFKLLRVAAMQLFDSVEGPSRVLLFLERNKCHESRDYYFILILFNQTTELSLPTLTLLH